MYDVRATTIGYGPLAGMACARTRYPNAPNGPWNPPKNFNVLQVFGLFSDFQTVFVQSWPNLAPRTLPGASKMPPRRPRRPRQLPKRRQKPKKQPSCTPTYPQSTPQIRFGVVRCPIWNPFNPQPVFVTPQPAAPFRKRAKPQPGLSPPVFFFRNVFRP